MNPSDFISEFKCEKALNFYNLKPVEGEVGRPNPCWLHWALLLRQIGSTSKGQSSYCTTKLLSPDFAPTPVAVQQLALTGWLLQSGRTGGRFPWVAQ